MPILAVGDLHFKEALGYADYVADKRIGEREAVLDAIVDAAEGCEAVVFMGDQLNSRTNHAETLKRFVAFLERFGDKELFLLGGNHDKWASGACAMDFLSEIKGKNWHVITKGPEAHTVLGKKCVFLPYMTGPELDKKNDQSWEEVSKNLVTSLESADLLFAHHAVSGAVPWVMEEVVLPAELLMQKYERVVVGHIHEHGFYHAGRILLTGSVFTETVGEDSKRVFVLPDGDSAVTKVVTLPCRPIIKVENPKDTLAALSKNAIVKAVITEQGYDMEALKKQLKRFDGAVIVTQLKSERAETPAVDLDDMTVDSLLKLYAKAKNIEEEILFNGFNLIK